MERLLTDEEAKTLMKRAKRIAYRVEYGDSDLGGHYAAGADRTDAARILCVGLMAQAIFSRLKP